MPVHNWSLVDDGSFHDFHTGWITHIKEALNRGILPEGYYAQSEQIISRMQTDVLALRRPERPILDPEQGGVALLAAPPTVGLTLRPDPQRRPRRIARQARRLVVRHVSGQTVVAVIEIVSPANKDRRDSVRTFVTKVTTLLESGVCVLVIDLLPSGRHDPHGMHGAVWSLYDTRTQALPADSPLILATYNWTGQEPAAYLEPTAVGRFLPPMPLFIRPDRYVNLPLELTYTAAYDGLPGFVREILEAPPSRRPTATSP